MKNNIPKTHLFTKEDLHLYEIQNIFTACALWLENGMKNQIATYDLVVRDMPKNRNFLLFGGLEEVIEAIRKWQYSKEEIGSLKDQGLLTPKLEKYLKNFKFSGNLYAMHEGSVFFPGEPIIRITAPLLEGNLFTMFLMNAISSNTIFLSKVIRPKLAAGDIPIISGGGMRAQSFESAMKGTRAGYIAGCLSGFPAFSKKYNLPRSSISVNAYHAVIKSFSSEKEAFRKTAKMFPNNARVMIDTYDFEQGIKNIIEVSRELQTENNSIAAITIDSGNLLQRSVYARRKFNKAGFKKIKIILASNLDEWKIFDLVKKRAPADGFLSVTETAVSADDPKLEIVYKLTELRSGSKIKLAAKFAKGKLSYPGRKQVFRVYNMNGKMKKDIVGLCDEKLGEPLLLKVINKGKMVYKLPNLDAIKKYVQEQIKLLPKKLVNIEKQWSYKVIYSKEIKKLMQKAKREHNC